MILQIKDWNIRLKIFSALGLIVAIALLHSIAVSYYLGKFVESSNLIINSRQLEGAISRLVQIDSSFTAVINIYTDNRDPIALPYYDERMGQYNETLTTIKGLNLQKDEKNLLDKVLSTRDQLFVIESSILSLDKQGKFDQASKLLNGSSYTSLKTSLVSLAEEQTKSIQNSVARYESRREALVGNVNFMAYGVLIAFILSALLISYAVSSGMIKTTRQIELAASAISRGETGKRVPVLSKDEIGRIAIAFNKMAVALDQEQGVSLLEQITKDVGQ